MTGSIRAPRTVSRIASRTLPGRPPRVSWALGAFAALALGGLAAPARADLIVLTDGSHLKVSKYEVVGDEVKLDLLEGGRLTLSIERVDSVVADEVLARELEAEMVAPPPAFSLRFVEGQERPDTPYADPIYESARRHGLNPTLVAAVVQAESRFNARAVSKKGARGLMQLMPATGRRLGFGPAELYEPEKNLDAGARYLRQLLDRFGELDLALAAYNAGEGAVQKHGGVPPYRETRSYVQKIYAALGLLAASGT
jgi:hypothetical protein